MLLARFARFFSQFTYTISPKLSKYASHLLTHFAQFQYQKSRFEDENGVANEKLKMYFIEINPPLVTSKQE